MSRLLLVLRHAKSSWDDAKLDDIDRPLNKRGSLDAETIGQHMSKKGLTPKLVLCSPAARTRQTWDIVSKQLKSSPTATISPELYDFGTGDAALVCIRKIESHHTPLMIIGHNPAFHNLAKRLITMTDTDQHLRLNTKFPTCALAVISFTAKSWHDVKDGTGRLEQFIRPKDLGS